MFFSVSFCIMFLFTIYFELPYCLSITLNVYSSNEPKNTSPELPNAICEVNNLQN